MSAFSQRRGMLGRRFSLANVLEKGTLKIVFL
jgi:hypothetical protein